jgi:hypothetical protein
MNWLAAHLARAGSACRPDGAARATASMTGYCWIPAPMSTCCWSAGRSASPPNWPTTSATPATRYDRGIDPPRSRAPAHRAMVDQPEQAPCLIALPSILDRACASRPPAGLQLGGLRGLAGGQRMAGRIELRTRRHPRRRHERQAVQDFQEVVRPNDVRRAGTVALRTSFAEDGFRPVSSGNDCRGRTDGNRRSSQSRPSRRCCTGRGSTR